MYSNGNGQYTLTSQDIAVIKEAKINVNEIISYTPRQPGLPPLWSRIPYLLLLHDFLSESKFFWKAYREFDTLLKNADRHYTPAQIPKSSGKIRTLMIPDEELRYHQRFILDHILSNLPISPHACAYRKCYGLTDLAKPHTGHDTLIHLDIRDFFSSITEQMVFEALLKETGYPKSVAGYLSRLCCYRNRLPQGACTSPALSNLCFKECDRQIAALAARYQLAYTRYSDDLYFSGNQVDAAVVIKEVKTILSNEGFRLRSDKTRVLGQHQAQKVTAIVVNEKMQVSRTYRRKLRQEIYYLQRFGENAKDVSSAESYLNYLYQLLGKISFVLYVDPFNREFSKARTTLERLLYKCKYPDLPF